MFDVSKVSAKGQVTIPVEIRRQLGIKEGDKVLFINKGNTIILANAAIMAFSELQEAFVGEAQRIGIQNEQDVVEMVKEIRQKRWETRDGNNA